MAVRNHEILKALIARKIKDPGVLWLARQIIDGSNPQEEEIRQYFPGDDLFTPAAQGQRPAVPAACQVDAAGVRGGANVPEGDLPAAGPQGHSHH